MVSELVKNVFGQDTEGEKQRKVYEQSGFHGLMKMMKW